MTTVSTGPRATQAAATGGLAVAGILRSEWTKFRSVRSTYWTYIVAILAIVGIGALVASIMRTQWHTLGAEDRANLGPAAISLSGLGFGQLAVGVVGVLTITTEYGTGMIRSTLAAVPRRPVVLASKAAVLAAVTFVVAVVAVFPTFFLAQAILHGKVPTATLGDPGVMRALIGAALYLTALALFALAIGALVRRSAGAIAIFMGLLLVVPIVASFLPGTFGDNVRKFLPSNAGSQLATPQMGHHMLAPWAGFAVFCVYVAVLLVVAGVVMNRRDA